MKMPLWAYMIVAFTMMQKIQIIAGQHPISEAENSSTLFLDDEPETCKARLDRIEKKFELQNRDMIDLRQDYEAFKAKVNSQQKSTINNEDSNEKKVKVVDATSTSVATYGCSYHGVRVKKPVRLLPFNYLFKNLTKEVFNDPPTNCRDLSYIGHTLNGYYSVQFKVDGEKKIGMIYCKFDNPDTKSSNIVEKKIGYMSMKSSPSVHFNVQINAPFDESDTIIYPYQVEKLNVGGAMNLTSGLFKAPVNGIYSFFFQGFGKSPFFNQFFHVHLYVNNAKVATSVANYITGSPVVLECTLKLRKGDQVFVKKNKPGILLEDYPLTHFSGSLIEEDLAI